MLGTNNFPDEYVAVAHHSYLYSLFFMSYLMINVVYLINQFISLYYVNYRICLQEAVARKLDDKIDSFIIFI